MEEGVGELVGVVLVRRLGALGDVAFGSGNFYTTEPGRLFVVCPLKEIDRSVFEVLALKLCLRFPLLLG